MPIIEPSGSPGGSVTHVTSADTSIVVTNGTTTPALQLASLSTIASNEGGTVPVANGGTGQTTASAALSALGGISAIPCARILSTQGNVTLNHTAAFVEVAAATGGPGTGAWDLTLAAAAGDILQAGMTAIVTDTGATALYFNAATIVSGSPVNWLAQDGEAGTNNGNGVLTWQVIAGAHGFPGAPVTYPVVSGDISSGNVVLRLYYYTNTATNRTLGCQAAEAFMWYAINLKH